MGKFIDLTGQKFGRLMVTGYAGISSDKRTQWSCLCECGETRVIRAKDLRNGKTKSCGCLSREMVIKRNTTHGMTGTRLHAVWLAMIKRCENPNDKRWMDYGGRGISVCEEWKKDFIAFRNWALANGYDESAEFQECTIERIDVNGNYEPTNCCWLSMKEQANNTRRNHAITYKETTHTMAEWGEITGITGKVIEKRLRRGWPIEKALTKPTRKIKRKL